MRKERVVKYPELAAEMARNGDKQKDLAKLLNITSATVCRKLYGEQSWKLEEIKTICEKYKKSFYELF